MNKEDKRKIVVAILPWAGLKKEIKVGPVTFWPWNASKIQDEDIKKQLERFFKIFVDRYGKPVNTIVVCSHGESDFHILEEMEYKDLLAAINILAFSSICPVVKLAVCSNNNTIGPPTAENYDFFGQRFTLPDDGLVVVPTRSTTSIDTIDRIHISRPLSALGPWGSSPNMELIGAFDKVFTIDFLSEIRERLFRSLEWFRLAHTETNNVSDASKTVMMSTAFEILLNFPEDKKSVYFAKQIEKILKKDKSIIDTRQHNGKKYTCIKAASWAYDFYQLRSKIVHGEEIKPENGRYKNWVTYNIVADLVFWELIVKELFENKCLGEKAHRWAEKFQPHVKDDENLEKFFLDWSMGFDDYHEALGWVEPAKRS